MDLLVLLSIFSASVIVGLFGFIFRYKFFQSGPENAAQEDPVVRPRSGVRIQNRNTLRRNNRNVVVPRNENVENEDATVDPTVVAVIDPKLGAKKRAKLEAKAEKKAKREADLQEREDRKKRQEALDAERKAKEDNEKKQELEKLALEEEKEKEKKRKEALEYLNLKEQMGVVEQGYEETFENQDGTLEQFINYIQENKVIVLDELALKFKLKTQVVIDRIQSLLEQGSLTGVIDDRGKFIYISQPELDAVASFIKKRGRVSLTELAEHSNNLIVLEKPISAV
ncbi:DDRGK domain-containing protein 1 isoform X1 [Melanaphis sacchari]|uniref:DDRGK domain-containing protein 1 isoform X1 n=1 Tax=Melanaphis sacchari TaxID=742174 RepID=UPI000DC142E2|nr:DDRGK domain-containing protein 1 isoform X1 [Melanaphis sacchari]